jgi:hypothetical protein
MIAYQRALARALEEGHGSVPGVPDEAVRHFARLAERKQRSGAGRCANAPARGLSVLRLAGRMLRTLLPRRAVVTAAPQRETIGVSTD